jgi:cell division protein FtsB
MGERLNALYEELIQLDEIAGQLDRASNAKTDQRRTELIAEIRKLESSLRFHARYA